MATRYTPVLFPFIKFFISIYRIKNIEIISEYRIFLIFQEKSNIFSTFFVRLYSTIEYINFRNYFVCVNNFWKDFFYFSKLSLINMIILKKMKKYFSQKITNFYLSQGDRHVCYGCFTLTFRKGGARHLLSFTGFFIA